MNQEEHHQSNPPCGEPTCTVCNTNSPQPESATTEPATNNKCCDKCELKDPHGYWENAPSCENPDCPCHSPKEVEEWEKEFDRRFPRPEWLASTLNEDHMPIASQAQIKAFIRERFVPKATIARVLEEAQATYTPAFDQSKPYTAGYNVALSDIKKALLGK